MTVLELIVDSFKAGYEAGLKDGIAYQLDMHEMDKRLERSDG